MVVLKNGNIGAGTSNPTYKFDVAGDINASNTFRINGTQLCTISGCTSSSDARLKQEIQPLTDGLESILKLRGVSYYWKDPKKFGDSRQIGLIAQELEKVYPEVVLTDSSTGFKSVAYDHLVAPLIESVKTLYNRLLGVEDRQAGQDAKIKALEAENAQLKTRLDQIEKMLQSK
jgi:hypothetical protein